MTKAEAIDHYLAQCVRERLSTGQLPPWPSAIADSDKLIRKRIDYHGIALLLVGDQAGLADWPDDVREFVRDHARLQALWEADHQAAIIRLIEALHEAGIAPLLLKGTALAYSVHADPAIRRRGDTDLLIERHPRNTVRPIFRNAGFEPSGDRRALQEPWSYASESGLTHEVDLHWAMSTSMAVSKAFERDHPRQRSIDLPRLSPNARGTGAIDSFIHVCINRLAHQEFGYLVDSERVFEGDRLIWAVDLHLLAQTYNDQDWRLLARVAHSIGAAGAVSSGIAFARATMALQVPENFERHLVPNGDTTDTITDYFHSGSPRDRLMRDLMSATDWPQKLTVLSSHLFPGREFMQQRYPDSQHWPMPALHFRRILDAGVRMLLGERR